MSNNQSQPMLLTPLQAFDAMRAYWQYHWEIYGEVCGPVVLTEIDYSELDENGEPITADPAGYKEWLEFVEKVLATNRDS